jgi:hypothetical protein
MLFLVSDIRPHPILVGLTHGKPTTARPAEKVTEVETLSLNPSESPLLYLLHHVTQAPRPPFHGSPIQGSDWAWHTGSQGVAPGYAALSLRDVN